MSAPANLNRVRKARARVAARKLADANAVKFGRSKAERSAAAEERARTDRTLDGAKREE